MTDRAPLTERDLVIAALTGRHIERRERGEAPCAQGALSALGRPRGRPPADRREAELAALRRRAQRAEAELAKARKVIEVQGNVSALLGELLEPRGASESTER